MLYIRALIYYNNIREAEHLSCALSLDIIHASLLTTFTYIIIYYTAVVPAQ